MKPHFYSLNLKAVVFILVLQFVLAGQTIAINNYITGRQQENQTYNFSTFPAPANLFGGDTVFNDSTNLQKGRLDCTNYPPIWEVPESSRITPHFLLVMMEANPRINDSIIKSGDYIGAFFVGDNGDLVCGGAGYWQDLTSITQDTGIIFAITGDDPQTPHKEGFLNGEVIHYKIFSFTTMKEYDIDNITFSSGYNPGDKWYSLSLSSAINIQAIETFDAYATAKYNPVCLGNSDSLAGNIFIGTTGNYTFNWTSTPPGFSSNQQFPPAVTPLVNTVYNLSVFDGILTSTHQLLVVVNQNPSLVNAGSDATICTTQSNTQLSGSAENFSSILWTTSGDGTFSNATLFDPIYNPGTNDKQTGSVVLTLNAQPLCGCDSIFTDQKILTFLPLPGVNAGLDKFSCKGSPVSLDETTATNYSSVLWTKSGDGTFSNPNILHPQYYPGSNDLLFGAFQLYATVTALSPCSGSKQDTITITLKPPPTAGSAFSRTMCEGAGSIAVSGSATNYGSLLWVTAGDGTFNNPNLLSIVYYPGTNDKLNGGTTLTLNAIPNTSCTDTATQKVTLTIKKMPVIDAGDTDKVCQGFNLQLNATASNNSSFAWTKLGDGYFINPNSLTPIYHPGSGDIAAGQFKLVLSAVGTSPCNSFTVRDTLDVEIVGAPFVQINTPSNQTVCAVPPLQLDASGNDYDYLLWTTSGYGSFSDSSILNPVYTPGTSDLTGTPVVLTLTGYAVVNCGANSVKQISVSFKAIPTASAGADANICQGSTHTLAGTATNQGSVLWATSGYGTFSSASSLNPVYTPDTADITAGTVTLTLTASANLPCTAPTSDQTTLIIQKAPTANAGADATICQGSTHQVSGTVANNTGFAWTTFGTGTFSSATSLSPVYSPSTADVTAGTVTLTLTATAISPCSDSAVDNKILVIRKTPVVGAGADASICQGSTHTLAGTASNQGTLTWTTSGTGTFSSTTSLTPVYTPSTADITAGTVTLTLTATAISPCTGSASDSKILTIQKTPTANAGTDATICQGSTHTLAGTATNQGTITWTTSGNGTFSSATSLTPIYTPGTNDVSSGTVTLTLTVSAISPCTSSASDSKTLIIQKAPVVNAGNDATICQASTHTLAGTASYQGSLNWTTSGNGTFSSTSSLNPIYTPGTADIAAGTVTLTLTATAISPCTVTASDNTILTIQKAATVNAGADATICWGDVHNLDGTASNYGSLTWTHSGDGTFSSISIVNPVYSPGTNDLVNGSVTLILYAAAISPCTFSVADTTILVIQKTPVAYAGENATLTPGVAYSTESAFAQNTSSITWSTSGDGVFDNINELHTFYNPGNDDNNSGAVTLTLTANGDFCNDSIDYLDIIILIPPGSPTANAGADATICENNIYYLAASSASNYSTLQWSTKGDGTFDNDTLLHPVYTPGSNDKTTGLVQLCIKAFPNENFSYVASDCLFLSVQKLPAVNAGNDASICEGSTHTLAGSAINPGTVSWTTSGTGTFSSISSLTPVYTPSAADVTIGTITLTLLVSPVTPCTINATDSKFLNIQKEPTANAGTDATICQGSTHTLAGTATNQGSVAWTTSGTGTFSSTTSLTPIYTPSTADGTTGTVTLTLTVSAISPCTSSVPDNKILIIQKAPTVNAGSDATICQGNTHTLAGSASNYGTLAWTTSGTGTFSSTSSITPIYTPGTVDVTAGTVTLTLTASAVSPCIISASDNKTLIIQKNPTVNAGTDATICQGGTHTLAGSATNQGTIAWTTSGNGTFSSATSLTPIYTPGTVDVSSGSVTLTLTISAISPCTASVSDNKILIIQKTPTANAGADATICQGSTHTLAGSATNQGTVSWTTSGNGTFSSTSSLTPIYTPGNLDIAAGTATLTLTVSAVSPCTGSASDSKTLIIRKNPTANAGNDATICQGSTHPLAGTATNPGIILWTTSGNGTFSSTSSLTPDYTPGTIDIAAGTVTLTLTVSALTPCTVTASDIKTLIIRKNPTAGAGADATICQGSTHPLDGTALNQGTVAWTTSGNGTYSSTTILNPVYTPGSLDIALGTATLTLTVSAVSPCTGSASDSKTLIIRKNPTANAGTDATICQGSTHTLAGSATNPGTILWTTSGNGTFSSASSLTPDYTPGTIDIAAGTATLTLTVSALTPCTVTASDSKTLIIRKNPTAGAGNDATICQGSTHALDGTATNQGTVAWTTSGNGTFSSASSLTPVYTPGTADIAAGTVTLTLTISAVSPCTVSASDFKILIIRNYATANAGADASICQGSTHTLNGTATNQASVLWTTSGSGTFSSTSSLTPVYTPGTNDITAGTVTLTLTASAISPCNSSASDSKILSIQKTPTANAGTDASICQGSTHTLAGTATNHGTVAWMTSGNGTFSSTSSLTPIYTPGTGDIAAGTVTLTLTSSAIPPCTASVSDSKILVIQKLPAASAGEDATICEGSTHQVTGTVSNNAGFSWTTSGTGTFSSATILNPVYTPGAADITAGSVILTLTATGISPCSSPVSDSKILTIQKAPIANAGADANVPPDSTYSTENAFVVNATSVLWSTPGDGVFANAAVLHTIYTPGVTDLNNGTVMLTLTASNAYCNPVSDNVILLFTSPAGGPTAFAGEDATICETGSISLANALASNYSALQWSTTGDGSFNDVAVLNSSYTPGPLDKSSGVVQLCLTAMPVTPYNFEASDCMLLTIQKTPTVNAGTDATICQGSTHPLAGTATNHGTVAWTTSGTGTFSSTSSLTPVYTPSSADVTAGTVTLTLTVSAIAPCTTNVSVSKILIIQKTPTANAGTDATICQGSTHTLAGTATNQGTVTWSSSGDGTFSSVSSLTPVYTPGTGDISAGMVTLTLSASAISPCTASVSDTKILSIQKTPTANAGTDATVCQGSTHTLAGVATNQGSVTWTTSGNGTFSSASSLTPVYTPGTTDFTAGSVTLTLTATAISPCTASVSDNKILIIQKTPTANAGTDATICQGSTHTLAGTATNQSAVTWVTSGDGTFSSASSLNPVYTPGTGDITTGTVTITLTATAISPCTTSVSDSKILIIQKTPTANAGADATICQGSSHTLAGTATNQGTVAWTTSGNGTFSSTSSLTPVYTPGTTDITTGTVTLTMAVSAVSPCTGTASDSKILVIQKMPTANAGANATICQGSTYLLAGTATNYGTLAWTTSGSGTFSSTSSPNPVYTPGTSDISAGSVTLSLTASAVSPCTVADVKSMVLTIISGSTASAGTDMDVCVNSAVALVNSSSTFYTSLLWTTIGDGTFDNNAILHPNYTPGAQDFASGTVTLCLTATGTGNCGNSSDCLDLNFIPLPIIEFGITETTICYGETYTMSQVQCTNYQQIQWINVNGGGFFDNEMALNPTYFPSAMIDYSQGCITLEASISAISPCTVSDEAFMSLCFQAPATVAAGADATICQTGTHTLTGNASNYKSVLWTTSGNGTFSSTSSLNTVYTPGTDDANAGSVTLTLTAHAIASCEDMLDSKILIVQRTPVVDAGADATILQTESFPVSATASNYSSLQWSTSGDGSFSNATIVNPVYTPGTADIANSTVVLTLTAFSLSPCEGQAIDDLTLTLSTQQQQFIQLNSGWNGLSSFVAPLNPAFDQVMAPISGQLVLAKTMSQVYWPEFGINTIGNFDPAEGYFVKMNAPAVLPISGFSFGNKTVQLKAGWNILPVLSSGNVDYHLLLTQLGSGLVIVTEISGNGIIWPEAGIYTIPFLVPGKAYLIKVAAENSFTFPD